MPLPAAAIGLGHDPRDTDEDRHRTERSEVVERVERGVDMLGDHQGADGQAERTHQGYEEQSDTVGRCGLRVWNGRVDHPKLFPLLTLLHALGERSEERRVGKEWRSR